MKVEWLILADAAQVVGNKLYLLGGGWDTLFVNSAFPVARRCAVAASFQVPWDETNVKHNVLIEILTDDGVEVGKIEAQIEVGRAPGVTPGVDQRAQIAADLSIEFQAAGTFSIVASIEGEIQQRTSFRVLAGPVLQNRPRP